MFAPGYTIDIPPMVCAFTRHIGWMTAQVVASVPASATWESASRAVYIPLCLPAPCVVRRVWWANGANVAGGATIEVGIYADSGSRSPGALLVSGSATQGNATEVQFVDVTDVALPPGLYWIAVVSDSATNTTLMRSAASPAADASMRFQQASAAPLPATATPAETAGPTIYLYGFSTTASP